MICKKWFLAYVNWCFFTVIVIRKAPSWTPYQSLYRCHGNKRSKHHYVGHHSWQQVAWWWLLLIKFDSGKKLYLGYHSTLRNFVQGVFSLFDEFIIHVIIYVFTDSTLRINSLKNPTIDATQHNFQCKQMFCNSSPGYDMLRKNPWALDVLMGLQRLKLFIDYSPK